MTTNQRYVRNPHFKTYNGYSNHHKFHNQSVHQGNYHNTLESFPPLPKEIFTLLKDYTKSTKPESVDSLLYPHYAENFQIIIKNLKCEKITSIEDLKYIYEANMESEGNITIRSLCTGQRNRFDSKILLVKELKEVLYDIVKDILDKDISYEEMDIETLRKEMVNIELQFSKIRSVISVKDSSE